MKTSFLKSTLLAVLFAALTLSSCDNENRLRDNEQEEAMLAENAAVAENESDDLLEITDQVEVFLGESARARAGTWDYPCAVVTNDELNNVITIDFGTSCIGPYGRERSGKIFIAYNGEVNDGISNRIITFENYVVNNKGVSGSVELRDIQENTDGTVQSTKKLVAFTITFPNGESMVYNGSRTRLWLEGVRDGDPSNNVFEITGTVEGIGSNGRTFSHKIVEPIIADWSCAAAGNFARVSGIVEIEKLSGFVSRKRTVDYGNGECDSTITVTIGSRTFEINKVD
jgi:hypothetical protein